MELYSTNNSSLRVSLREAVLQGLPPDNGLYMPIQIPVLDEEFWQDFRSYSFAELATRVAQSLLGDAMPGSDLEKIVHQAINFDAPLVDLTEELKVLELFHGPTLAFK
ncbi:MAG: threonine synthase, partial [Bacteroidota bacterium]